MATVEGDRRIKWALVAGVAGWNIVQNSVSRRTYGRLNAFGVLGAIGIGRALGLSLDDLGVGPGALRRGWRVGGPPAAAVALAVAAAAAHPRGRQVFRDERVERRGPANLALEVLFRIPVGTALFEEFLFRGLLWGWWAQRRGGVPSTLPTSAAFGLWHVLPTLRTLRIYRSGRLARTRLRATAAIAGAVIFTGLAGAGFGFLRRWARSVYAPVILHATVNMASYVAAWLAAGDEWPLPGGSEPALPA